jgi:peptide/nickel transport system permease protein
VAVPVPAARPRVALVGRLAGVQWLLREILRRPSGLFGLSVVVGLLVVVAFAPWLAPYDHAQQDVANRLQGPSEAHVLGTDQLGRDLLSRLMFGSRVALGVAFPAVLAAVALGLVLGLVAGYAGGRTDTVLIVILDTLQAFPGVILALTLLALLGPSLRNVVISIAVAFVPNYARVSRALILAVKENLFVEAERSLGASNLRIILVHMVPNILAPLFILLAMDLPAAITVEAGLSFLGLGVQPPTPSWGVVLADGFERVRDVPWPVVSAGLTLMVTTLGFTLLGETLRDIVDPRLAGLRRWRQP